ncbi:MAG TPA: N-acetylmuramic acid 6-phosphate etherase [Terriglobia bacterium]|nr:N-acetylmuramic acid 6-phosphate etherase [Terriglobia bacterium]
MKQPRKERITEAENPATALLDTLPTSKILRLMNREDQTVALAVRKAIPQITRAVELAAKALAEGGRLIYVGAGTSGRLGVLDAAECIPTFGSRDVIALMPGGRKTVFQAVEDAEDNRDLARQDLKRIKLTRKDVVAGLAASGRTPYTLEALRSAKRLGAKTIGVTSNPGTPLEQLADVPIVVVVGPEVVAGSTRLKAGTAEKLVLNMLSTATMIRLGRVLGGWMIHVQLTNQKLWERGRSILSKATGADKRTARRILTASGGNLPAAMLMFWRGIPKEEALRLLGEGANTAKVLRKAWKEHLSPAGSRTPRRKTQPRGSTSRRKP